MGRVHAGKKVCTLDHGHGTSILKHHHLGDRAFSFPSFLGKSKARTLRTFPYPFVDIQEVLKVLLFFWELSTSFLERIRGWKPIKTLAGGIGKKEFTNGWARTMDRLEDALQNLQEENYSWVPAVAHAHTDTTWIAFERYFFYSKGVKISCHVIYFGGVGIFGIVPSRKKSHVT